MKKIKKFFATGLLVVLATFSFLGSAISNIAKSIFSFGSAQAAVSPVGGNTGGNETKTGYIVYVPGFETSYVKNASISIPFTNGYGDVESLAKRVRYTESAGSSTYYDVARSNIFVEITDPFGQALTKYDQTSGTALNTDVPSAAAQVALPQENGDIILTPAQAGIYKVKYYVLTNDVWTETNYYDLRITAESYEMKFGANDAISMPTMFKTTDAGKTIDLTLPLMYDNDGELITSGIILGGQYSNLDGDYYYELNYKDVAGQNGVKLSDVTKLTSESASVNTFGEYKTYTVVKKNGTIPENSKYALYVEVNFDGTSINNYSGTTKLEMTGVSSQEDAPTIYDKAAYSFTTTKGGKHVITYKLCNLKAGSLASNPDAYLTHTITGSSSYDESGISLVASTSSNIKRSDVSYKVKKYLPSISAIDTNNNNSSINAFYFYTIQVQNGEELDPSTSKVAMGHDENGFYFIPKATRGSTYQIGYEVIDSFGHTSADSSSNDSYTVTIWDDDYPTAVFTESYDAIGDSKVIDYNDPDSLKSFKNISYIIPTKYQISGVADESTQTIVIPALAGADYSGIYRMERTLSADSWLDNDGKKVDSTKTLTITANSSSTNKYVEAPDGVAGELRNYLRFRNTNYTEEDEFIDIDGYVIYADGTRKTDGSGAYIYAFVDSQGNPVTGTDLRNAYNSCEAIIKLDKNVFGAGTYTLSMRVQEDGQMKQNDDTRESKIELVNYDDESFKKSTPNVQFGNSRVSNVGSDQQVEITVPTASDDIDKRLNVRYFVDIDGYNKLVEVSAVGNYVSFKTSQVVVSPNTTIYDLAVASGSFDFDVVAFAFNDYSLSDSEIVAKVNELGATVTTIEEALKYYSNPDYAQAFEHVGFDNYNVTVRHTLDSESPVITSVGAFAVETPTQYTRFEVPGITFTDDTNSVRVEVSVTDTKGASYPVNYISSTKVSKILGGYRYEFPGVTFLPSNADRDNYYTVTYTLLDAGNNVVSYSVVLIHAIDKEAPVISGLNGTSETIEYGESYRFSKLQLTDNLSSADNIKISATVTSEDDKNVSNWFNPANLTFSPEAVGTYTITFTATDEANVKSQEKTYTIYVKDTLSPTITLKGASSDNILYDESKIVDGVFTEDVEIPTFTVQDSTLSSFDGSLFKDGTTGTLTITAPVKDSKNVKEYSFDMNGNILNGATNTLNLQRNGNVFTFRPTSRGQYVVTYSATDGNGNSATSKVITVDVGDTQGPDIYLTNEFKAKLSSGFVLDNNATLDVISKAIVYKGDGVSYDYGKYTSVYVNDAHGFDSTYDSEIDANVVSITIAVTDSNGNTVSPTTSGNVNSYSFTTAGSYTIKITVSDKIGNSETLTQKFTVTTKESGTTNSTNVLGIVLIVVSSLILVGVVVYFVLGAKKVGGKNKKKKTSKEQKNEEK